MGVTVVVYLFSLIDGVIACPHDGLVACKTLRNELFGERRSLIVCSVSCSVDYARKIGAIAIALDILTDLMSTALRSDQYKIQSNEEPQS